MRQISSTSIINNTRTLENETKRLHINQLEFAINIIHKLLNAKAKVDRLIEAVATTQFLR